jgi:hypothetical protein
MDPTFEYLWAAGYDLPPDTITTVKPASVGMTTAAPVLIVRRGKKAAKAKRARAKP